MQNARAKEETKQRRQLLFRLLKQYDLDGDASAEHAQLIPPAPRPDQATTATQIMGSVTPKPVERRSFEHNPAADTFVFVFERGRSEALSTPGAVTRL